MEFPFLPNLPKPNLDDRTFDDLVRECMARIPRYCPEWTNYNPSDPGVTIIELFAYLTDQMLSRFNKVPLRNYVAFLELLGIRLKPPTPARTELTFYLSRERQEAYKIEAGTEVATERTETEEAIAFSTDEDLIFGNPRVKHFFTGCFKDDLPIAADGSDRPVNIATIAASLNDEFQRESTPWQQGADGGWTRDGGTVLFPGEEEGSCFYLVIAHYENGDGETLNGSNGDCLDPLKGNVIALTFRGEVAGGTGSILGQPPRVWEAWNAQQEKWVEVLRQEADDRTQGFTFADASAQGADVILHLPTTWQATDFQLPNCRGYWIRCYHSSDRGQGYLYSRSPRISAISARSIGGTVAASQCTWIREPELLGVSNGEPGQSFELQNHPVLKPRRNHEYLAVVPPGVADSVMNPGEAHLLERYRWQEVEDFAESNEGDLHYAIEDRYVDSEMETPSEWRLRERTTVVQFGPLILEPGELQRRGHAQAERTNNMMQAERTNIILYPQGRDAAGRRNGRTPEPDNSLPATAYSEIHAAGRRQYGAVPPKGYELYMVAYRTGGGTKGNVRPGTLTKLMVARSYIKDAINYEPARGGTDAESLERAVMRVPAWLRTQERAVTTEDFEYLAKRADTVAVARSRCLDVQYHGVPGQVQLLVIPKVDVPPDLDTQGMPPAAFRLEDTFREALEKYLSDRKLLGIKVAIAPPQYVGVKVRASLLLAPAYENSPKLQEDTRQQLAAALYRFLNPLTGGTEGNGWQFDRPVYRYELADCCQKVPGVSAVIDLDITACRQIHAEEWQLDDTPTIDKLKLAPTEMVCSWRSHTTNPSHKAYPPNTAHELYFLNGLDTYLPPERRA